jgi:hypothetical protein
MGKLMKKRKHHTFPNLQTAGAGMTLQPFMTVDGRPRQERQPGMTKAPCLPKKKGERQ